MTTTTKVTLALGTLLAVSTAVLHAQPPASLDAAAPAASMPAGAVQRGTLTSEQLRADAMTMAATAATMKGCTGAADLKGFQPFMSRLPEGAPGARTWSEIWVFTCSAVSPEVRIDFKETADGGADYSVRMN